MTRKVTSSVKSDPLQDRTVILDGVDISRKIYGLQMEFDRDRFGLTKVRIELNAAVTVKDGVVDIKALQWVRRDG